MLRRIGIVCIGVAIAATAASWTAAAGADVQRVAVLSLSKSDRYDRIAVAGGRIVLYRSAGSSSVCSSAVVDPATLALSDVRRNSCADPGVFHRSVVPAIFIDKDRPARGGGPSAVVRIAHVTAGSPGYTLGPIVMTFPALAYGDSHPSWIYAGGDLWLYDWVNRFDLLRISATTGAVLQRLEVPKIRTPLMAVDDDGLWIAPYGESSGPLYRIAPGATKAAPVFVFERRGYAGWLVASGHSLWLDAQPRPVTDRSTIWALRGSDARPVWHGTTSASIATALEEQTGPTGMVGDRADGLWTAIATGRSRQTVIRMNPESGKLTVEATLATGYEPVVVTPRSPGPQSWTAVAFRGSLFLLDPPTPVSSGTKSELTGFSALYRITPNR
jgi:hypothetical protein